MASDNCRTYHLLVDALIAATKELEEYNVPECYGIVTLLRNLNCTQRTNVDAAKALVKRLHLSLEGE